MDFEKLNKSLVPLTNIAVLVGVILLIFELRQNHEILELDHKLAVLEASHLDVARFTAWRQEIISDHEVADLFIRGSAGEELESVDHFRFVALCNDLFWAGALMHERSTALQRDVYEQATIEWGRQILQSPGLAGCWEELRDVYILWGYSEFVDGIEQPLPTPAAESRSE